MVFKAWSMGMDKLAELAGMDMTHISMHVMQVTWMPTALYHSD
jgi:hypothetical protein